MFLLRENEAVFLISVAGNLSQHGNKVVQYNIMIECDMLFKGNIFSSQYQNSLNLQDFVLPISRDMMTNVGS